MPQMAPINWLLLSIIFILTFLMFNMLNYFIFNMMILKKTEKKLFNKNNLDWKW